MPNIKQSIVNELDRSCWVCGWNKLGTLTLMGTCGYFEHIGKEAKEIPATICDKGCKAWENKVKIEWDKKENK